MTNTVSVDTSEVIVSVEDTSVSVNVCENIVDVVVGETGPQGPKGTAILTGNGPPSLIVGLVGDLYIDIENALIYGPKTSEGWGSGVSLGGITIEDVAYTHLQVSAATVWTINHNLQFVPNITVVDFYGNGEEVIGNYVYGNGTITAYFEQPIAGAAYLS